MKSRPQNFSFLSSKIFNTNAWTGLSVLVSFVRLCERNGRSVWRIMKRDTNDREKFLTLSSVARFELVRNSRCLTLGGANSTSFLGPPVTRKFPPPGGGCEKVLWIGGHASPRERGGNLWKLGYHWLFDSYEWEREMIVGFWQIWARGWC